MELSVLIAPLAVNFIVWLTKNAKVLSFVKSKKGYFRAFIGVLMFVALIGKSVVFGEELDITSVTMFVETGVGFLLSQGAYFLAKKKKVPEAPEVAG
ncbi:MAG: hypothetical protein IH948_04155 [Bacteroidetes bacterium]|nr:hypothetical protein [Bacteroidota bacterium]